MPEQPTPQKISFLSRLTSFSPGVKRDAPALLAGVLLALFVGWGLFPQLLYSSAAQPINFNHAIHIGQAGLNCADCHHLRKDGSFAGIPSLEDCTQCHSAPLGKNPEELRLIENYIKTGKEIPWLNYATQPSHVFFSHAAHALASCNSCHKFTQAELCALCHGDMSKSTALPPRLKDRITGYGKDIMRMAACERCHALPGHAGTTAFNTCATCHK